LIVITYRFQNNDKPWSDEFLAQEIEHEWRRRLKPFRGELNIDEPGQTPGVYKDRSITIHRAVTEMTGETKPGRTMFVANKNRKGVRCHAMQAQHPFGPIFPCIGPCVDNYPNMVIRHNAGGQIFRMQEPAAEAYAEAERLNGRPIRITGEAWRSCSQQSALYHSDPGRFANPDTSRHCRGLAMDVYNDSVNLNTKSRAALISVGFSFPVSGEPWHASYGNPPG
jgi:hypothetical protein